MNPDVTKLEVSGDAATHDEARLAPWFVLVFIPCHMELPDPRIKPRNAQAGGKGARTRAFP